MNERICQSCGMPLPGDDLLGTNADGSRSADYCKYCYDKGAFLKEETLEEMIATCVPFMVESNPQVTPEQAKALLEQTLPSLKRWRKSV